MMDEAAPQQSDTPTPRWQPLAAYERRVAGVLVEKAKTTPEQYPLSLNALRTGCNQKNNRDPVMSLELEQVEAAVDRLRELGAAVVIQGGGRVSKYRHALYEWLGVDKVEMAVMAELLLRGAQTEGELRGRAARMEPIADLAALRPVLAALKAKGLVVSLTPEGRGHMITHALYTKREWERVRAKAAASAPSDWSSDADDAATSAPAHRHGPAPAPPAPHAAAAMSYRASDADSPASQTAPSEQIDELRREWQQELESLRDEVAELRATVSEIRDECERLKRELGVV